MKTTRERKSLRATTLQNSPYYRHRRGYEDIGDNHSFHISSDIDSPSFALSSSSSALDIITTVARVEEQGAANQLLEGLETSDPPQEKEQQIFNSIVDLTKDEGLSNTKSPKKENGVAEYCIHCGKPLEDQSPMWAAHEGGFVTCKTCPPFSGLGYRMYNLACAICYKSQHRWLTGCGHVFCDHCIREWNRSRCPSCRNPIYSTGVLKAILTCKKFSLESSLRSGMYNRVMSS